MTMTKDASENQVLLWIRCSIYSIALQKCKECVEFKCWFQVVLAAIQSFLSAVDDREAVLNSHAVQVTKHNNTHAYISLLDAAGNATTGWTSVGLPQQLYFIHSILSNCLIAW